MKILGFVVNAFVITIVIFIVAFLLDAGHVMLFAQDFLHPTAVLIVFTAFFLQLFQIGWN